MNIGKARSTPFSLEPFHSRHTRVKNLSRSDTIYAKPVFSLIAVLFFVVVDFYCLYVVWNLVQTEDKWYLTAIALASAMALDVPLAIAAIAIKRFVQGMSRRSECILVSVLSVAVFVITFVLSFNFRLVTRDLSFKIGAGDMLTNNLAASETAVSDSDSAKIAAAALFNAVIPLLTSISSFVISFFSYDPLGKKIAKLQNECISLQSNILTEERAMAEADDAAEHCRMLTARENDLYGQFLNSLEADRVELKQLVRRLMMEKLSSAESVTVLSRCAKETAKCSAVNTVPGTELPQMLEDKLAPNISVRSVSNITAA